ncbi:MAG: hypothetical protein IPM16_01630 [Chloroflexi bacterium]|nr:hypothetical protein [Chloroflexota bacterium]
MVLIDSFNILIGGTAMPEAKMDFVRRVEVELTTDMPAACTITMYAGKEDTTFVPYALGDALTVQMGPRDGQLTDVFKGEIVGYEHVFNPDMTIDIVMIAHDKLHRLNRGRIQQSFLNVTDSDVITQIVQTAGLAVNVTATSTVHPSIVANNVTPLEFIQFLAARNGYTVRWDVTADQLKIEIPGQAAVSLAYGSTLEEFRPRFTAARGVGTVKAFGWDPKAKAVFAGTQKTAKTAGDLPTAAVMGKINTAIGQFGTTIEQVTVLGAPALAVVNKAAEARFDDLRRQAFEAEGLCRGNPAILPGKKLTLSELKEYNGDYYPTVVRHVFYEGIYDTRFYIEGRTPNAITRLMQANTHSDRLWYGVYPAVVTNINDSETNLGRVKVKLPWFSESIETDWARIAMAGATTAGGLMFNPQVNDEVLVAFEDGQFDRPFVIGGLWNTTNTPPVAAVADLVADGKTRLRGLYMPDGAKIEFVSADKASTKKGYYLTDAAGNNINVNATDKFMEIKTVAGFFLKLDDQNKIAELKTAGGLSVKMEDNAKKVTLTASSATVTMDGNGNKISLSAANIEISGSGSVTISGGSVKIN